MRISYFVNRSGYAQTARELLRLRHKDDKCSDFLKGCRILLKDKNEVICFLYDDTEESIKSARKHPMGTIVIDSRNDDLSKGVGSSLTGRLLPELLSGGGSRKIPGRNSIIVVLPDDSNTPYHAYAAGTFQLGGVLIAPENTQDILESAYRIFSPGKPGKVALALAGGGIEGMFWEIGVLRALDAHLKNVSITDFDIFSGISAGSIISAFLANGVKPYEIANALYGRPSRINPITRSMLFDPNIGELTRRIFASVGDLAKGKWLLNPIDSAMRVTPTALFSGQKLKNYLENELSKPGMSNSFNTVPKKLFVGVTDQDKGQHVTFGTAQTSHIPISTAVRASSAMTPYYNPEKIGDRYYVDGIFTRTIDIDIAVENGATLIICVDPLRPVQTLEPGYVSSKGGVFNTVQSIKSMIRTRFAEMITKTEETYPHVSVHVFSPTAKDMEQMSGTMMRFFYSANTENMAYDSAGEQIAGDFEWLAEDLIKHGIELAAPEAADKVLL